MKWTREQINKMLDDLHRAYPDAQCALEHRSVYQLLVAVTLSAQTTDVSVNKISGALFARYPDAQAMAAADQEDVMELIKTIGLYKTKSKRIIDQAKMLCEKFAGRVPEDDDLLQQLPGVGRKTANVVMADGFGHQRIAVDTHVFRVANRIGLVDADDVTRTEMGLRKVLPRERWTEAHHSLIFHGRRCCSARKPKCETCPIAYMCLKRGL
ncbi:MAG: endonuclease III [Anaerovoracaceae bacterium]|jgi:endonuclease-3